MRKEISVRLLNVFLRGLSMLSRFLLIFFLARLLEPSELGLFGLILATVSFSVLFLGADYYTYSQRELLAREPAEWSFVIQHQIKAQLALYVLILPILLIVFWMELLAWKYLIWFYLLLISEHISQEINRLLIALHKQLLASWILFIRMGSWVIIVLPLMYLYPELKNVNTILAAWFMGSISAMIVGWIAIKNIVPIWKNYPLDKKWIFKGFKIAALFFIATLCLRGLLTFDRYAVEALDNPDVLGVYVFYIGIVVGLVNILDPAVFSFLYPKMLQSFSNQDMVKYKKTLAELALSTLLISSLLAVFEWIAIPFILDWVGKPVYASYLDVFRVLIVMGLIYALGMIPHYALYAMRKDRWIIWAQISSLVVFFCVLMLFPFSSGIMAVASALLIAFCWMGLVKSAGFFITKKQLEILAG